MFTPQRKIKLEPLSLLGMSCFLVGVLGLFISRNSIWNSLVLGGFFLLFGSLLYYARKRRRSWLKISARCTERAVDRRGRGWVIKVSCDFELNGEIHSVKVGHWRNFSNERLAQRALERLVTAEGGCTVYVNPRNPEEFELGTSDIKDFLFFWRL